MGLEYSPEKLADTAITLARRGVHNINFVTPDHFWPHVSFICKRLREESIQIPMLFNSSGYTKPEMVAVYAEDIDIFMPDFKFADPELAMECMNDATYPEIALESLREMVNARGFLAPWDPTGREPAREGVLVRHLVLPGHVDNSLHVLRLLHKEFGPKLPISVMSQFHPVDPCFTCNNLTRKVSKSEFLRVYELVEELGFEHAYVQSIPDSDAFLPDFSKDEPFEGNAMRDG